MFRRRRRLPPPPPKRIYRNQGFSMKTFYRLLICFIIFGGAILLNQTEDPLGERMVAGIQYFLSTESDVQPVLKKVVDIALQMENVQWPLVTDITTAKTQTTMGGIVEKPLRIPVSGKILLHFGWQDSDKNGYEDYHEGIDIKADIGTPVKAAEDGIVEKISEDKILGTYIILDHGSDFKTLYGQLDSVKVEKGQKIKRGQVVATVGESGVVEIPHLHFEVREKGSLINPISRFNINKGI